MSYLGFVIPLQKWVTASAVLSTSLVLLLVSPVRAALPPQIEMRPVFGDTLVSGRWQPIALTLTNGDTGEALTGEATVSVGDPATGEPSGVWTAPITLPRGAGAMRTTVTVYVPESEQPDISVVLRQGRDGRGGVVTRRTFAPLRFTEPSLTLLTVTAAPDALSYLRGETLGVENATGVLRVVPPVLPPKGKKGAFYGQRKRVAATAIQVETLPEAGMLPTTAAGYDTIGALFLGADIPADQFSDSQVAALRGWVVGGGLLVVASPTLRLEERFRTWVPVASDPVARLRIGRGTVAAVTRDLTETGFGRSMAARLFWLDLLSGAVSEPLLGNLIQGRGVSSYYRQSEFWQSVVRAPGLKAPPAGAIALFLGAYLVLLVPVNYLILKRLDRREWTWATVPILVTLFSVGAYGFGYAVKGTRMLQNTVTLCEMGANRGDAVVTASIGVFSPRRARYKLSPSAPDTTLWSPEGSPRYGRRSEEYAPLEVVSAGGAGGDGTVYLRNAEVSMWSLRVFAARTTSIKLGKGVAADLTREGDFLVGSLENRTGRRLEGVRLCAGSNHLDLKAMGPGERQSVRILVNNLANKSLRNSGRPYGRGYVNAAVATTREREFTRPVAESVDGALDAYFQDRSGTNVRSLEGHALLLAWNREPVLPIKVDDKLLAGGTTLNLLAVAIPLDERRSP
ncbi:MAG: hypothetical protein H7Z41_02410 [Cytophagales bacterium]|nr:hypothetical protein [Armatimonadota bacterium]